MFESIELRKVANGFIVIVNTESEVTEYVFDTPRRATSFLKTYIDPKNKKDAA